MSHSTTSMGVSITASGAIAPDNSVSQTATGLNSGIGGMRTNISSEALAEQLSQVALYELFTNPPSVSGNSTSLEEFFEDVDTQGNGAIPFRTLVAMFKPVDVMRLKDKYPMDQALSLEDLAAFVE